MAHFVQFNDVTKTYRMGETSVDALSGMSFEIDEGELVVILGPSGAGKTTLLNLLGGMDTLTSGEITVAGVSLSKLNSRQLTLFRRHDVGFVFQFYNLMPNLTARENIELATEICKNAVSPDEALKLVGLTERAGNFPAQLSGGEQQRVSIARALAKNPKLVLCDEPTGALDYNTGKTILKLLQDTCRSTVISVSGDGTPADVTVVGETVHLPDGTAYTIPADRIRLHGKHNAFDIAVVYAIAARSGITDETFTDALISYEPLPHRLQPLGEIDGIRFYDDSISTIGETTMRALDTLPDTDTVLIGGMERGIDYTALVRYLSDSPVKHILLMEATGERIYKEAMALPVKRPERFETVGNLENAVAVAKRVTAKGKICLLSPAAASYGIFKNFEERGEVFQKLVKA